MQQLNGADNSTAPLCKQQRRLHAPGAIGGQATAQARAAVAGHARQRACARDSQRDNAERPSVVIAPTRPTSPRPSRARLLKRPKQLSGCCRSQTIFTMLKMAYETIKSSYNTTPFLNSISHHKLLNIAVSNSHQT